MIIRKYPAGDTEKDRKLAPKRDTNPTYGNFGAIVYVYKITLEPSVGTSEKHSQGTLYHPVDTPEDASFWLNFYKQQTTIFPGSNNSKPVYVDAYFVPRGDI